MTRSSPTSIGRRALALGAAVSLAALLLGGRPIVPLYDGVVPVPPYRWLDPPPGQRGEPQGATAKVPMSGGSSPLIAVATPEDVPQAQVFAIPGGLIAPPGTTSIDVSIEAVQPPAAAPPPGQVITGNVYAILVTNQAGGVITANPSAQVSVVLRAPDANQTTASLARYDGTAWQILATTTAGVGATFEGVVTAFGEFALLAPPPAPTAAAAPVTPGPTAIASASNALPSPAPSAGLETPEASEDTSGGSDHMLLTLGLGGLALLIVVLVAVAAFMPRRRSPPPRGLRRR